MSANRSAARREVYSGQGMVAPSPTIEFMLHL